MPEGLGDVMTPPEMNDLIAFVKKPAPRPFGSASAPQVREARAQFISSQPGASVRLVAATEQLDYPSWLGRLPLWHCRQTDGASRVEWEVAAPISGAADRTFRFAAAMGFRSQPTGGFILKVNGRPMLEFDVALNDSQWESRDGTVRMSYSVMEANSEDSNGLLTIVIPHSAVAENGRVRFEVAASGRNSQRWFGIYDASSGLKQASKTTGLP
jgi:hypothetical protein